MLATSLILALGVAAIYILFAPVVILGIYIFFDRMAEGPEARQTARRKPLPEEKEPELWTPADVRKYLKGRQKSKLK